MDPITIGSAVAGVIRAIPAGGGKKKVAAALLRAKEVRLLGLATDFRQLAERNESLSPGALRMAAFLLEDQAAGNDAIADLLTGEDDKEDS